jgi:hypothetical protein
MDMATCDPKKEAELIAQGWEKRFMADEPRLGEAVEEYRGLGFEVLLVAVDSKACADSDDCTTCLETPEAAGRMEIIFTRRQST